MARYDQIPLQLTWQRNLSFFSPNFFVRETHSNNPVKSWEDKAQLAEQTCFQIVNQL